MKRFLVASSFALTSVVAAGLFVQPVLAAGANSNETQAEGRLDRSLRAKARSGQGTSRVIFSAGSDADTTCVDSALKAQGGLRGRKLNRGQVAQISNARLLKIAQTCNGVTVAEDREVSASMERTPSAIGATTVWDLTGLTGAGIGVAVIDSGVTSWHDDLTRKGSGQRVTHFKDFVNALPQPYDDFGHGTHVAGIIAGNGFDSNGGRTGVAPGASIISLKALDAQGGGYVSNVIAAIDYAVAHKDEFNIRVINLSVGAGIYESYNTDPLTLAAKRAVDAGIVVVAAAGNLGKDARGRFQYGGITAPGNAPWVLTVGAESHMGTVARGDDTMAGFSSHGPSYLDWEAKPDLVAPGVGIESLSDPTSAFYTSYSKYLLAGTVPTSYRPYLSLSGTSMASPVVAGTVVLMLQANPSLTPNAVKAILQYTAEAKPKYDPLTVGAGFLNALGAVRLSAYFKVPNATAEVALYDTIAGQVIPWGRHIHWGNFDISGGIITPGANAWTLGLPWGATNAGGKKVVWGRAVRNNVVRGRNGDNVVWGSSLSDNIVWGSSALDNIVWGSNGFGDNIVWGSKYGIDNIVWGSNCLGLNCDNIVWGSNLLDNIVWGSNGGGDNIVWGSNNIGDNIVWGSNLSDNIVWGSSVAVDNIVWGSVEPVSKAITATVPTPVTIDHSAAR